MRSAIPLSCLLFAIVCAIGCTKTGQQTSPPQTSSAAVLDSAYFYSTGPKEIVFSAIAFHYDDQGRFTGAYETGTDSTLDHVALEPDTSTLTLTYNGTDSLPATYTLLDALNVYPDGGPGTMSITYDNQGRATEASSQNPDYTKDFIYGSNYILVSEANSSPDSIILEGGNVSRHYNMFSGTESYAYSNYPNPFYSPRLAAGAGAVFFIDFVDLISKNLFSQVSFTGLTPRTMNYTWQLDDDGRVVSGTGADGDSGEVWEYYRFVYKK